MHQFLRPQYLYGWLFLLPFSLLIAAVLISSYGWRPEHDTPHLQYAAWLWHEFNTVPYRDLFETSMPGTLAFHIWMTALLGYADTSFRLADIASVCLLYSLTLRLLWPCGRLAAISAASLFTAIYLGYGQTMSLQRDYLGVIALAACLNLLTVNTRLTFKALGIGLLLGCAALIKPHLVIGAPVILWLGYRLHQDNGNWVAAVLALLSGGLVPLLGVLAWLGPPGALPHLADLLWHYLPLYNQINGNWEIIEPGARVAYHVEQLSKVGGFGTWFVAALFGAGLLWQRAPSSAPSESNQSYPAHSSGGTRSRDWSLALLALLIGYGIYAALAGKYWAYHFMPFIWFCVIGSCLLLQTNPRTGWTLRNVAAPLIVVLLTLNTMNGIQFYPQLIKTQMQSETSIFPPKAGRVDAIADYLRTMAKPGDLAQPLDVTGGAVHAMFDAKIPIATPFVYDYHFYHHIDAAYIKKLRARFMQALRRNQPRFIIEITARNKPHLSGPNTVSEYPELELYLQSHYTIDQRGKGYRIFLRRQELLP